MKYERGKAMHWIEKFRAEYKRKDGRTGISRDELAKLVRRRKVGCSPKLIDILEHGGITHPRIANAIAAVCEADEEQRNSIVHETHRGKWTPPPKPKKRSEILKEHKGDRSKLPQPLAVNAVKVLPETAKAVVQIDLYGREMARFCSISEAAQNAGVSLGVVQNRIKHRLSDAVDEYQVADCTWRFAEEWDAMSDAERTAEVERAHNNKKESRYIKQCDRR